MVVEFQYLSTDEIHQHNGQQNWTEHRTNHSDPKISQREEKRNRSTMSREQEDF